MNDIRENDVLNDEDSQRAYAQWVEVTTMPFNIDCKIRSPYLDHGKFYEPGNKNHEISASQINGTEIKDGKKYTIAACGRANASTGTQGSFEVEHEGRLVFKYWFSCPWNSKKKSG